MIGFIDEIGIEREAFLVYKNGIIVEPKLFGFPFDEFGFLVEIRSAPCMTPKSLLTNLKWLTDAHRKQAKSLGLELRFINKMSLPEAFVKDLSVKYGYSHLKDLTANIRNGVRTSHATGLDTHYGYGTAGMHIHFSRKTIDGKRVQLPIYLIVKQMDDIFSEDIIRTERVSGEYEIKPHGFEYRSLPTDASLEKVVNTAFKILWILRRRCYFDR